VITFFSRRRRVKTYVVDKYDSEDQATVIEATTKLTAEGTLEDARKAMETAKERERAVKRRESMLWSGTD
jgi:hypothetical protein